MNRVNTEAANQRVHVFSFPSLNKDSFLQFENTPEEPEVRVLVRSDCAISQSILLTG